jgi:nucleotide-binding universal stress UspA family protein
VIGARQNSLVRSLLGSVSARVAAEAACTVTVVRPPRLASLTVVKPGAESRH